LQRGARIVVLLRFAPEINRSSFASNSRHAPDKGHAVIAPNAFDLQPSVS